MALAIHFNVQGKWIFQQSVVCKTSKLFDSQAQLEVNSGDTKKSGIVFAFFWYNFKKFIWNLVNGSTHKQCTSNVLMYCTVYFSVLKIRAKQVTYESMILSHDLGPRESNAGVMYLSMRLHPKS